MPAKTQFSYLQGALDVAAGVDDALVNLVTFWIAQGVPFTSGHATHVLRTARPDLRFAHQRIGSTLRQMFEAGQMPAYDDGYGGDEPVVRVARLTTRTDTRTPPGTQVFVYGPSDSECNSFEFEIDIATAPQVQSGMGGLIPASTAILHATPGLPSGALGASPIPPVTPAGTVAVAKGTFNPPGQPVASVHADGRLCIPRGAFEALAYLTGVPVTGGDTFYALETAQGLTVNIVRSSTDEVVVRPTTDRCRVHLTLKRPVQVGDSFGVEVGPTGLSITF